MKGFDACQRAYDNEMPPDDEEEYEIDGEELAEAQADNEKDEIVYVEKQQKKTGRYTYTEAECDALNKLGW